MVVIRHVQVAHSPVILVSVQWLVISGLGMGGPCSLTKSTTEINSNVRARWHLAAAGVLRM